MIGDRMIKTMIGTVLLVSLSAFSVLGQEPAQVVVTPIINTQTTAIGQPILLPKANAEMHAVLYEIPVGATLAVHKHPYQRYAYVLAGKLRVVATESAKTFDYATGDMVIEVVDTWHYGVNTGDIPVRLLVIDQVEAGEQNTITQQ
jgi:quercetin dioxygenase-like cupin family protein